MASKLLICPVTQCLRTFNRNSDLKDHINEHLHCRWSCCLFCHQCYYKPTDAFAHIAICPSQVSGASNAISNEYDARYPLLVVWSPGMGLPSLKMDGSGGAEMVVRNNPVQVWECARDSRQITYRQPHTSS